MIRQKDSEFWQFSNLIYKLLQTVTEKPCFRKMSVGCYAIRACFIACTSAWSFWRFGDETDTIRDIMFLLKS